MKHVKNKPPALCEYSVWRSFEMSGIAGKFTLHGYSPCGCKAKHEHHFKDPKAKPMMVCGVHKRVMERK